MTKISDTLLNMPHGSWTSFCFFQKLSFLLLDWVNSFTPPSSHWHLLSCSTTDLSHEFFYCVHHTFRSYYFYMVIFQIFYFFAEMSTFAFAFNNLQLTMSILLLRLLWVLGRYFQRDLCWCGSQPFLSQVVNFLVVHLMGHFHLLHGYFVYVLKSPRFYLSLPC